MDPATIDALELTVDLRAEPWRYPGPFLPFSCLQVADRLHPLRMEELASFRDRHFVIAIGSNASPDVLRRKFLRRGVSTTVPHIVGTLEGVSVGHSAHVGVAGYVPAAPYPSTPASTPVVVSALTDEQRDCVDETERNYDRISLPRDRVRLALPVELPRLVHLYASKWGVLADGSGLPLPFGVQDSIFEQLAAWRVLPPPLAMGDGVRSITQLLSREAGLRDLVRGSLVPYAKRFPRWE